MTAVDAVRARLRAAAEDVTALRAVLLEMRASVPPSAQETSQEDLDEEPDVPTALRAALDHALRSLAALKEDLLDAAAYEPSPLATDGEP